MLRLPGTDPVLPSVSELPKAVGRLADPTGVDLWPKLLVMIINKERLPRGAGFQAKDREVARPQN